MELHKLEKLVNYCQPSQKKLKTILENELSLLRGQELVQSRDGFLYSPGNHPVLLVAHLDTVHQQAPTAFYIDKTRSADGDLWCEDWHWEQEMRMGDWRHSGRCGDVRCAWCDEAVGDTITSDYCQFCYSELSVLCDLCGDGELLADCIIFDSGVYCRNCLERPARTSRRFRFNGS